MMSFGDWILGRNSVLTRISWEYWQGNCNEMENNMLNLKRSLTVMNIIIAVNLTVACSSIAPRQWQPTSITDFKSVAGKWEGLLTSNDPKSLNYDRATLVIDSTGGCESAITRTRTKVEGISVSYDTVDVFAEKGKLVLADGKLNTKFEKGGQMTAQLYVDPASGERMLKAEGRNSQGYTYAADLKRTGEADSAK